MYDKTKEQLLVELSEVQKMLEEKTEFQGHMIRKFQMLITNEGLFSQIIDSFPYPIAIFTPQYTLPMMNKAFMDATKILLENPEKDTVCILRHKIDNMQLSHAVTQVFAGGIFFLDDLKNPFSMFSGLRQQSASQTERFSKAAVFPIPNGDTKITHGVIVFMP